MTDDTPEMIRTCLSCPWPRCWDCFGRNNAYSYGLRLAMENGGQMMLTEKEKKYIRRWLSADMLGEDDKCKP